MAPKASSDQAAAYAKYRVQAFRAATESATQSALKRANVVVSRKWRQMARPKLRRVLKDMKNKAFDWIVWFLIVFLTGVILCYATAL